MFNLDDLESLAELDRGGMRSVLEEFPDQCRRALELGERVLLPHGFERVERIVTTGMGGSGIAGDLLARLIELPVIAHRGYGLPHVDEETLVIAVSYSGNTEETLSSLDLAVQQGAKLLCVSIGGELERLTLEYNLPFIKVPGGLQPRAALGYLLLPLLKLLCRLGLSELEDELVALPQALGIFKERWAAEVPLKANRAKQLARRLYRRVPLIYGVEGTTDVVAFRWKTGINENSKQPAFWNSVPELCHNEIVALERAELLPHMKIVLLQSGYDHARNRRRIEILEKLFTERLIEHEEIRAEGEGKLTQLLSLVYLGDFVSFYLAMLNNVDPTPVELIAEFKRRLGQQAWAGGN
jgi:glucose/mannose-6-phosphate isomerase